MQYTFITGSTGVLGKEFATVSAKSGENLFLTGRTEQKLIDLKDFLLKINPGIQIDYYPCDLTDEKKRQEMFDYAQSKGFKFKKLINVAGADIQKPFTDYTQEKIVFQVRANFESAVSVTKFFLDNMQENGEILTISSLTCTTPMPYFALYSASKSALTSFMRSLRYELKSKAKVTVVLPGSIPTRKDVIEDIKRQGLTGKLSSKPKEFIVKKSLAALKKNKAVCVPGFYNKIVYFFTKITPRLLQMKIVAKKFSQKTKDAF